jgi:hypothetical protein
LLYYLPGLWTHEGPSSLQAHYRYFQDFQNISLAPLDIIMSSQIIYFFSIVTSFELPVAINRFRAY